MRELDGEECDELMLYITQVGCDMSCVHTTQHISQTPILNFVARRGPKPVYYKSRRIKTC